MFSLSFPFACLSSLPPHCIWLPPLAAELGAPVRHSLLLISREMDRADLPVVLAAWISAPSSVLTCPDLNSPFESEGRTVRDSRTKQKWDWLPGKIWNICCLDKRLNFCSTPGLEYKRGSIVIFLLCLVGKLISYWSPPAIWKMQLILLWDLLERVLKSWIVFLPIV